VPLYGSRKMSQSRSRMTRSRTRNQRSQSRENFGRSRSRLGLKTRSLGLGPLRLIYIPAKHCQHQASLAQCAGNLGLYTTVDCDKITHRPPVIISCQQSTSVFDAYTGAINVTAGGVHRPIGFGWMLCMSDSHKSMQGPGIVDVIAAEVGGRWVGESITGRWSRFTGYVSPLSTCSCLLLHITSSRDERN